MLYEVITNMLITVIPETGNLPVCSTIEVNGDRVLLSTSTGRVVIVTRDTIIYRRVVIIRAETIATGRFFSYNFV